MAELDTKTLLAIFAGCARDEISRYFLPNSCIASSAIAIDVLKHFGMAARPWEVCLHVIRKPYHLEIGCYPPEWENSIGGHLVVLAEHFLVDASFGQITDANPNVGVPPVFVGELPMTGPPYEGCSFSTPFAEVHYVARVMSQDYRKSLDWGPSPEREAVTVSIITRIRGYCLAHGLAFSGLSQGEV